MSTFNPSDELFVKMAVELAEGGRFTCAPNPCVGCVIVKQGKIIGRGFHQQSGEAHAEVHALQDAQNHGHSVKDASVYVSLEPCAFVGRTPACAQTLIDAQVGRVVIGYVDPHPKVSGQGIAMLQAAGIVVDVVGEFSEVAFAAAQTVRGFVTRVTQQRPYIRIKTATSLDGAIATASGQSKWITSDAARHDVQYWRARSDAVVTGVGTVLADDPQLNVRDEELMPVKQPLRVVLDRSLRTPLQANLLNDGLPTLICHNPGLNVEHSFAPSVEVLAVPQDTQLETILGHLAQVGCNEILVEAGPQVVGAFVKAGLWDEWIAYVAPKLLGHQGQSVAQFDVAHLEDAPYGKIVDSQRLGNDLRFTLRNTSM